MKIFKQLSLYLRLYYLLLSFTFNIYQRMQGERINIKPSSRRYNANRIKSSDFAMNFQSPELTNSHQNMETAISINKVFNTHNTLIGSLFTIKQDSYPQQKFPRLKHLQLKEFRKKQMFIHNQQSVFTYQKPQACNQLIKKVDKIISFCFTKASKRIREDNLSQQKTSQNESNKQKKQQLEKFLIFIKQLEISLKNHLRSQQFAKKNRKSLTQFLNMIYYGIQSMHSKNYNQIEKIILNQSKNCALIKYLKKVFFEISQKGFQGNVQSLKYTEKLSLEEFKHLFHIFREIFGQVLYAIFHGYFRYIIQIKQQKSREWVIDRLSNFASRFILVQSYNWQFLYIYFISDLIESLMDKPKIIENIIRLPQPANYCLKLIFIKYKQKLFPKTAFMLTKFIKKHQLTEKLKYLKKMRQAINDEILQEEQILIRQKAIKKLNILEKDDIITCYIHCIIKNQIDIHEIEKSLREIQLMLEDSEEFMGNTMMTMLGIYECASYFADLEAVTDFIKQEYSFSNIIGPTKANSNKDSKIRQ